MDQEKSSYGRILKSSSIVGGAQGVNMLLGMVRVKVAAVLLGPVGIGLVGTYLSIQSLAATLSGLGVNSSGVRDVAEAAGTNDSERIGRTVLTLRRICWLTGLIGAILLAVFAVPLSYLTFENSDYAWQIALLGLSVLLGSVSAGQMALVQGMRRIGDLARLNILTSIAGTIIVIGFYAWLGLDGIIPSLLTLATVNLAGSFWFSRRVPVSKVAMSWRDSLLAARGLVTLGLAFMWSGLLIAMVGYTTRALISREIGLVAVGVFTAAFGLSGMVVNFILGAMGADFYPSLTAVSHDHQKMGDLVNQQTEIGVLLATPCLLATLALAPWVIQIFYTPEFAQSADLLQWFALGCLGRVISWPMAFIILAKGSGKLFALSETLANVLHLALIWLGLRWIGVEGVAIAFCFLYISYTAGMVFISRYLINFHWSATVWRLFFVLVPISLLTMVLSRWLPIIPATISGAVLTIFTFLFCVRGLCFRLGREHRIVQFIEKVPFSQILLSHSA